jgi:hypothetical protein
MERHTDRNPTYKSYCVKWKSLAVRNGILEPQWESPDGRSKIIHTVLPWSRLLVPAMRHPRRTSRSSYQEYRSHASEQRRDALLKDAHRCSRALPTEPPTTILLSTPFPVKEALTVAKALATVCFSRFRVNTTNSSSVFRRERQLACDLLFGARKDTVHHAECVCVCVFGGGGARARTCFCGSALRPRARVRAFVRARWCVCVCVWEREREILTKV